MKIGIQGLLFGISVFLMSANLTAQDKIIPPNAYVAPKISETIKIDGKAKESSWKKTKWTADFIDIQGEKTPKYKTKVKMLWDDDYLYFYAEMEEPHVWATLKQRDTIIFYNNDFEIFIDPDGDTHNYMEFEMNALNTVWDLYLTKPYREHGKVVDSWDIKGIKTAVAIKGTINDASDEDKGWSVEIAMPWNALKEAGNNKVPADDYWRINFSRVNWDYELVGDTYQRKKDESGNFLPEYNWVWSPQWVINMHEPEWWGYVYFSTERRATSKKSEFVIPADEKIKWELYSLYRKQKSYHREHGSWIKEIDQLISNSIKIDGEKIKPTLEVHNFGWNLSVVSPFTGKQLILKEDGDFIIKEQ
ncbi:carbohydrate-binding family 9-like protein [Joostella sp.]|uniref:carbohydrate-binding family 9-like protein n=1 Tax=Joostella sp. TaxID=2231138 RepID=UPI003A92F3A4